MNLDQPRPFRPRYPDIVSPYKVGNYELRSRFEHPFIGLDGGILIPQSVITRELDTGSILGTYLALRTMQTGERYAVTHDEQGDLNFHSDPQGTWHTSRRMATYYGTNYGAGPAEKSNRYPRPFTSFSDVVLID